MPLAVAAATIGSAVVGAKMQSSAAQKGRDAQQTATDKAVALQQQQTAPYRALGEQAVGRLNQPPPDAYRQQFTGAGGSNGFQPFQPPPQMPQGPPPGGLAGVGMGGGPQGPPQGMAQGPMVKLQGPDGSVRDVPAQLAEQFIQRGARRVG